MNDNNANGHLSYDELLQSVSDASDLDQERQAHLTSCRQCRTQAEDLEYRYHRLGQMAKKMAPEPSSAFRVPAKRPPARLWRFNPGVAIGLVGVLVFAFTMLWPHASDHGGDPHNIAAWSQEEDERFMAEVDDLIYDAMPKSYQHIAVVSEPIFSKDLIDWIVPSIDDDYEDVDPRA